MNQRRGAAAPAGGELLLERGEPRRRQGLAIERQQDVPFVERAARGPARIDADDGEPLARVKADGRRLLPVERAQVRAQELDLAACAPVPCAASSR